MFSMRLLQITLGVLMVIGGKELNSRVQLELLTNMYYGTLEGCSFVHGAAMGAREYASEVTALYNKYLVICGAVMWELLKTERGRCN